MAEKKSFFDWDGKRSHEKHGRAEFDLPIFYYRDDLFLGFFLADLKRVKEVLPSRHLHPVTFGPGRAIVVVGAFYYINTSIGPYGEIPVGIPVVWKKPSVPFLPALLEKYYPGFGIFVLHLPVTSIVPRDAGRGVWNYPKFVADMKFRNTPEFISVEMEESGEYILGLRVDKRGPIVRDNRPLVTYTEKDGKIIKTVIPVKGAYMTCMRSGAGRLDLGDHPVAESIKMLGVRPRPILTRYYVERAAILPEGEVVGESDRRYDGYRGKDLESGKLIMEYR